MSVCNQCGAEAVGRCLNCGELYCAQHGDGECQRCTTAIQPGDPGQDRVSSVRLRRGVRQGWWRPQQAEDYQPPECHWCKGLARRVCLHCQQRYCREHAGSQNLCVDCGRSSNIGVYILAALGGGLLLVFIWNWLSR